MGLRSDRAHNCAECQYMKTYDYGKRIYYCDHEERIDDMGKVGVGDLPKESPEWCPLRERGDNQDTDADKG
nr:hypothetical protein [uncultured Acetatifactor sp.]